MHILEGEALMNDASGLVALKFAIAAALTGMFSLRDASITFVIVAAGGLATGAGVAWLFSALSTRFLNAEQEGDPAPGIVMTLLVPFAAPVRRASRAVGRARGVSAGMMMNYTSFSRKSTVARARESTWAMIEFVFNGMVFIMLQLPHIIGSALVDAHHTSDALVGRMIFNVCAMMVALYAIRFLWVWLLRWIASRRAARQAARHDGRRAHDRGDDGQRRARRGHARRRAVDSGRAVERRAAAGARRRDLHRVGGDPRLADRRDDRLAAAAARHARGAQPARRRGARRARGRRAGRDPRDRRVARRDRGRARRIGRRALRGHLGARDGPVPPPPRLARRRRPDAARAGASERNDGAADADRRGARGRTVLYRLRSESRISTKR
jgi:CPA1 family monovalent cation:H+ antiporter